MMFIIGVWIKWQVYYLCAVGLCKVHAMLGLVCSLQNENLWAELQALRVTDTSLYSSPVYNNHNLQYGSVKAQT